MDLQFEAALKMAEITIIKRDFDLLRKLITTLKAETQFQLIPYTALLCSEAIDYISRENEEVDIEQTSRYSIKDIRQKAKFFDLSVNKLLQSVDNVDSLQNDYFISLMKFPKFGAWNIHNNLGVFYDNQKNIVGNTHYAYYLFQDEKMISKPKESMKGYEVIGEEIYAFAYDMGRIIGSISSAFSIISDFMVADVLENNIVLHSQDFNTNRCYTKGNKKYKILRLFLLHIISSIGFILYILKKLIIRDSGLLLRLEYITYHYTLIRLENIATYCRNNAVSDEKLIKMLENIDYSNGDNLRKTEFRNCMMHFGLKDIKGNSLINEEKFNLALPFCGLVESQFNVSYEEYKSIIESKLYFLYNIIRNYLDFNLLLSNNDGIAD